MICYADLMDQLEMFAIPSPCRGICQSGPRGYCRGCLRSRDERFNWQSFTSHQKREVIRLCELRRRRLMSRKTASGLPSSAEQQELL